MKKTVSLALTVIMAVSAILTPSALVSCSPAERTSVTASAAEAADNYLRSRLTDYSADNFLLASGEEATALYADLADFTDEGYIIRRIGNETAILAKTDAGLDRGVRYYVNSFADSDADFYSYGNGYKVKSLSIAGRDIADYAIRISPDADECHRFAASELQKYIARTCGAELDIVTADAAHMIVLEQVTETDPRYAELGDEGFTVEVKENGDLFITGGRYRGCLYGIYSFLEDYVGWRFIYDFDLTTKSACVYTRKPIDSHYSGYADAVVDYLYEAESVDIPAGTKDTQIPGFAYRQPVEGENGSGMISPELYNLKLKQNGQIMYGDNCTRFNGYGINFRACHGSTYVIMTYPDYEGLVPHTFQPCFTDPDLIEYCSEYYINDLKNRLNAGQQVGREITSIDVSQADSGNFCTCDRCRKQYKVDRCHMGEILTFANGIADAVAMEISPDVYCAVLSYFGTTAIPKKTRPVDNISISYCYYNDLHKYVCYAHPFDGSECMNGNQTVSNAEYAAELSEWCKIATQVIVWYYPGTWHSNPLYSPNVFRMLDDFRFMADCGVYGVFVDSSQPLPDDGIISYLELRLMWDPYVSEETFEGWIHEYLTILCGPGGDDIFTYMKSIDDSRPDCCWTTHVWSNPAIRVNFDFYRNSFDEIVALFDNAAAQAETELQEYRVINRSLTAYFNSLVASYESMYQNGTEEERETYRERWDYFASNAVRLDLPLGTYDYDLASFDLDNVHPARICDVERYGENGEWWNSDNMYFMG